MYDNQEPKGQLCVQRSFGNWNIILKSMVLKGFLLINCRGNTFTFMVYLSFNTNKAIYSVNELFNDSVIS